MRGHGLGVLELAPDDSRLDRGQSGGETLVPLRSGFEGSNTVAAEAQARRQPSQLHRGVGNVPRSRGGNRRLQVAHRRDRLLTSASVMDRRWLVLILAIRLLGVTTRHRIPGCALPHDDLHLHAGMDGTMQHELPSLVECNDIAVAR